MRAEQQATVAPAFFLALSLLATPLTIRGHQQPQHNYGVPGSPTVVLLSGDGGWIHVAPHLATVLAASGHYVVGVDSRAYLEGFTGQGDPLRAADVQRDFLNMIDYAGRSDPQARRPLIVGVSEGAGLAVIAAGSPAVQHAISGVISVGLPGQIELGWRWRDSIIYITHTAPNEPLVDTSTVIGLTGPVPLALLYSSHDEFISAAGQTSLAARAGEPSRRWTVAARDHRFSDNLAELDRRVRDAVDWIGQGGG